MIMSYFVEGRNCFLAGKSVDDCKYDPDSEAYKSWVAGWDNGWYEANKPGGFK